MLNFFSYALACFVLTGATCQVTLAQRFSPVVSYPVGAVGSNPRGVAVGDVNGDGHPDLVTANYVDAAAAVLLNRGDGTFAPSVLYPLGADNTPYDVTLGDFNRDGSPDIATANYLGGSVTVLLNQQNGTFAPAVAYPLAGTSYPESLAVADVNNDGYPDLLAANLGAPTVAVLLNRRDGTFAPSVTYAVAPNSLNVGLAVGDLNKDGYLDIAAVSYNTTTSTVGILFNRQDGTFAPLAPYALAAAAQPVSVAVGDVNRDGYPDILTANAGRDAVGVMLNQQNGTLAAATAYATGPNSQPYGIVLGDVDGDGYPDAVTGNVGNNTAGVLLNRPDGTFAPVATYATGAGSEPSRLALGDVNRDGRLDIVTSNSFNSTAGVLLSQVSLAALPGASTVPLRVVLYPNPVLPGGPSPALVITGLPAAARGVAAVLLDALGREVSRTVCTTKDCTARAVLPTTGLAPGLYVLRLVAQGTPPELLNTVSLQRLSVQ